MFNTWAVDFGKVYADVSERNYRLQVFTENYYVAKELTETDLGTAVYDVMTSPFADLTTEEFAASYLSPIDLPSRNTATYVSKSDPRQVDEEFDWRDQGVVTPVKNQGSCGSCWAFSATAAHESVYAMAGNDLVDLSPQFLVDCDTEVDMGCKGGLMDEAYKYIIAAGGIPVEADYPYEGKDSTCRADESKFIAPLSDYIMVGPDEDELLVTLQELGPLAVAVNASWLQFYRKGVSEPRICNPDHINHGILMMGSGFGEKKGKTVPSWTLKNSWGSRWGEDGFFRLRRGKGTCGINTYIVSPVLAEEASLNA
eukprot:TRINITY_DN38524_c0_g1_i1.p2 TRINITY_DN38524_c0_g1~~TRINITY_DN38524_c0_g1_i1.p2  ORF type:complete len:338 (+),score=67.41 TRINITY_DN38524_c0_g1_i1:80-1015(+)